jgi:ribosomal protein L22
MVDEKVKMDKTEKVEVKKEVKKVEEVKDVGVETKKDASVETKEEKVKEEKPKKDEIKVKDVAVANAYSLRISSKYSFSICKVIKNKTPEAAIKRLEEAAMGKRAIPMAGREVAHQKGKGMSGGKFPKNACNEISAIIKQVKANAVVAGIDNPVITIAQANRGSAPFKSGGRRGKRTHLHLEVRDKSKLMESSPLGVYPKGTRTSSRPQKKLNKGAKK